MKKSVLLVALFWLMSFLLNAQHYNILDNSYQSVKISFQTPDLQSVTVQTANGNYTQLGMDGSTNTQEVGKPQLPVLSHLIEIPICESVMVNVLSADYEEVDAADLGIQHAVMPVQPTYSKSYRGERPFVRDEATYSRNEFYAMPLVQAEKCGVMRDANMASLTFSPVAYNPVTGKFRVCRRATVEITYRNANIAATLDMKARYGSPLFTMARNAVINPMPQSRNEFTQTRIKYLIIANSMFANNDRLLQFVNWKKRIGYEVVLAFTSDPAVGTTTTSIKNFILSHYTSASAENPAPSFVLLVGDVAQIPAFSTQVSGESHVTDLYYATWTSGDYLPDCYYSRLSAQSVSQLEPQIDKILMYEQHTMPDDSYLGKAVLIAGTDENYSQTHANGQVNYIYNQYVNPNSTTHNYTTVYKHNYNCNSQAATIRSEIGAGVGLANYTAHGSEDGWYQPQFNNSQVSSMTNEGKYGVIIGNCCVSGKFNVSTCFGEALLRAANKGAMAYIGASNNSYWDEDYYWAVGVRSNINANPSYSASNLGAFDRVFHTHNENHNVWATTLGGMVTAGNAAVESTSSTLKRYYWEIYHIFGDASIRPYLGIPNTMTVNAPSTLVVGATSLSAQVPPYAYVALTYNNTLVGAGFADASGNITLTFNPINAPGVYELAVGAQNYVQYFQNVNVVAPDGAYVMASQVTASPSTDPVVGQSMSFDVTLQNYGLVAASNVALTLTSSTAGVQVMQGTASCASLVAGATSTMPGLFNVTLPQDVPDGTPANFTLDINWGTGSTSYSFQVTMLAPILQYNSYTAVNQAGSQIFSQGDVLTFTFNNMNVGHAVLPQAEVSLTSRYYGAVADTISYTLNNLQPGQNAPCTFQVRIGNNVPDNALIPIYYHKVINGVDEVDTLQIKIGASEETFETGDFSLFPWSNNSSNPWIIVSNNQQYAGSYCARSKQNLSHSQSSVLQITLTSYRAGEISYYRKVSSERGYDFFHFYIDGVQKEELSGTSVAWGLSSFPVEPGTHTYKFEYVKDGNTSSGSDCAWIDNVTFPGYGIPVDEDEEGGGDDPGGDDPGVSVEGYRAAVPAISLFPNPADAQLTLHTDAPVSVILLYDLNGRILGQYQGGETRTLDVSSLAPGLYFLKVQFEKNQTTTAKFIKQ